MITFFKILTFFFIHEHLPLFIVSFYFRNQTYAPTLRLQEEIPLIVGTNMLEGLSIQLIETPVTGASRICSNGITTEFANKSDFHLQPHRQILRELPCTPEPPHS